jgi:thiamine pyrophosphate-dependent acetolactate synthase large subunit-like protein
MRERHTCDDLADAFVAEGVDTVFGLFGDGNLTFMAAMDSHPGTRVFQVRHEAAAVFMAAGYCRATGGPGLATVTAGPGLAHTLTPLVSACRAGLPVILYAGDTAQAGLHLGGLQEFDHHAFAELAGAMHVRVADPRQARNCVADAVRLAVVRQRPVVLSVAEDCMESLSPTDASEPGTVADFPPLRDAAPVSTPPPAPSPGDVAVAEEVFAALSAAKAPMLVAGSGAVAAGVLPNMRALAHAFGATLATTFRAKGCFDDDPSNVGIVGPLAHAKHQQIQEQADLIVGIGANLHGFGAFADTLLPGRTICLGAERYGGIPTSHPCGREISVGAVTQLLSDQAKSADDACGHHAPLAIPDRQQAIAADFEELPELFHPSLVDPRRLMLTLDELLPDNCVVVIGGGHFWSWPLMYLSKKERDFVFPIEFGSIGMGLPTGIGISAAGRDRNVVVIEGDGGTVASVQELETASRHGLALTVVVMNDATLGAEFHKLAARGLDADASSYQAIDFAGVAAAFGASGTVVRSVSDLPAAYAARKDASCAHVIDARVSPEITSRWYRRLHYRTVVEREGQRSDRGAST